MGTNLAMLALKVSQMRIEQKLKLISTFLEY